MIEVKSGNFQQHTSFTNRETIDQCIRYIKFIPDDYIVYLIITPESDIDVLKSYYSHPRFLVTNNITEIKPTSIPYYSDHAGLIRSLASFMNDRIDHDLRVLQNIQLRRIDYNRAICIMNDNEMVRLANYNFRIVDKPPKRFCKIVQLGATCTMKRRSKTDRDILFNEFYYGINLCGLSKEVRSPLRCVDGITEKCNICYAIMMNKYLHDGVCRTCIKSGKRVKINA